MTPIVIATYDDLLPLIGRDLGCGEWTTIDADKAARFADACARGPDGPKEPVSSCAAAAPGRIDPLLLLSSLGALRAAMASVTFAYPSAMNIFYGYDNVRFREPPLAPARVRLHLSIVDARRVGGAAFDAVYGHRLEASTGRIVLAADVINRIHLRNTSL